MPHSLLSCQLRKIGTVSHFWLVFEILFCNFTCRPRKSGHPSQFWCLDLGLWSFRIISTLILYNIIQSIRIEDWILESVIFSPSLCKVQIQFMVGAKHCCQCQFKSKLIISEILLRHGLYPKAVMNNHKSLGTHNMSVLGNHNQHSRHGHVWDIANIMNQWMRVRMYLG